MDRRGIQNNRGVALMTAVVGTILLTLTAAVVLNFTMRRFETTALRVDRWTAFHADEGAVQYAWARLTVNDTNPLNNVKGNPPWNEPGVPFQQRFREPSAPKVVIISSDGNRTPEPHHIEPFLKMRGKDVTVEITWDNPDVDDPKIPNWAGSTGDKDDFPSEFQLRASTDYGT